MTLDELTRSIINKKFVDQTNHPYTFVSKNALRCGICIHHLVHYQFYEAEDKLYLNHSNALGSDDKIISVVKENPLTLSLIDKADTSRFLIWTEV